MNATLQALTAAGVVYNVADFADPHLSGPTALTVTADGRVFGHLATHDVCHIGFADQCVTPPTSRQAYKYFHQGVVSTDQGDLPVGKITLGTGHAELGQDAVAAAAHYDNTGSTVAVVRAGEDRHGIWLAGRMVPGVDDARVDELRRSGVSGDWRGIGGNLELVAALAVNVPGFPVPRTEQLVASGGLSTLVAAGVVVRPAMPSTPAEFDARVAAAIDARDRASRRAELSARMSLVASAVATDKRARLRDRIGAVRRARALDAITAAGPAAPKAPSAPTAPGQKGQPSKKGERRIRSQEGAKRYGMSVGDLIGEDVADAVKAVDGAKARAGEYAEAAGRDIASLITGKRPPAPPKEPAAPKPSEGVKKGAPAKKVSEFPDAPAPRLANNSGDPNSEMLEDEAPLTGARGGKLIDFADGVATYDDGTSTDGTKWTDVGDEGVQKILDAQAANKAKTAPAVAPAASSTSAPVETPAANATNIVGPDEPAPRLANNSGDPNAPMLEDEAPLTGQFGGNLVSFSDGVAEYDDGTTTDGTAWTDETKKRRDLVAAAIRRINALGG